MGTTSTQRVFVTEEKRLIDAPSSPQPDSKPKSIRPRFTITLVSGVPT
jgi:hypothetical protein